MENINNTNAEIMKNVYFKKIDHTGIRFKYEILRCICSIEKNDEIKVARIKNENHVDISFSLSKLAEVESKADNRHLQMQFQVDVEKFFTAEECS